MSISESALEVSASSDEPIFEFVVVDGPFETGAQQWLLEGENDVEFRDWTEHTIPQWFPSALIRRFHSVSGDDRGSSFCTKQGFRALSLQLLDFVNDQTKEQTSAAAGRQIVFISHGFGGSLVKNALLTACYEPKYTSIPDITRAMIFFATPHRAVSPDTWEDIIFRMLSTVPHERMPKGWRISEFAGILEDLRVEYSFLSESWPTYNIYTLPDEENKYDLLSKYQSTLNRSNAINYSRIRGFAHVARYEANDSDLAELLGDVRNRILGLHGECLQELARLVPIAKDGGPFESNGSVIPDAVLNSDQFKRWVDCEKSTGLLLTGKSGSLAVEVSKLVYDHICSLSQGHSVSSYEFDKSDARQNSQSAFFLGNTQANLIQSPEFWPRIEDVYKRTVGSGRITKEDLFLLYRSLVRAMRDETLIILINNPEECEDLQEFLSRIQSLARSENPVIKLIVATEAHSEAAKALEHFPSISVDWDTTALPELQQTIEGMVATLIKQRPVFTDLKKDILEHVSRFDNFIQIQLVLDLLRTTPSRSSPASLRPLIHNVESDLGTIIEEVFARDLPLWSQIALHWIVHAARPLNRNELALAVAWEDGFEQLSELKEKLSHDIGGDLKQVFGPLITIRDGSIRVLHDLVRQTYKKKYSGISDGLAAHQWRILKLCIDYLSSQEVQGIAQSLQPTRHWMLRQKGIYALTSYAATFWPRHYKRLEDCDKHADFIAERLNDESFLKTWTTLLPHSTHSVGSNRPVPTKPIHFAAELGFNGVVRIILGSYADSNSNDDDLTYALELAAKNGHSDVVEQLLNHGVKNTDAILKALEEPCRNGLEMVVNALVQKLAEQQPEDLEFPSPLLGRASRNGHAAVAEILLRAGAPVDAVHAETSPLHHAVTESHNDVVKVLLEGGANVDSLDDQGYTPLHLACKNADPSIVKQLLDYKATPDTKDAQGFAALHLATSQRDQDSVMLLLKAGADPTSFSNAGKTPLHMACENGSHFIVEQLMARDVDIDEADDAGASPLLLSCEYGHEEIAKVLISKGARPDGFHDSDTTPLVYALSQQNVDVATLLIENGADVSRLGGGVDPLSEAAKFGLLPLVELMLKKGASADGHGHTSRPIHSAALGGFKTIIEVLLEQQAPADIDAVDDDGSTALHLAAAEGHLEIVQLLIDKGSDITITDTNVASVLHRAAAYDRVEVVAELLERGAYIEAVDDEKRRPLHRACCCGGKDTVKLLLEKGALHDEGDSLAFTPLMLAARQLDYLEICEALLDKGADPRHMNSQGDTPLHIAAWNNNIKLMEVLIERGEVNVDILSDDDETPLFRAYFYDEAARWLLDHGANPNATSKDGTTPLMFMARQGDEIVVRLLLERDANVHAADSTGASALHIAASTQHPAICSMLLDKGANPDQRDQYQLTPLLHAAMVGPKSTCEALIEKGAGIEVTDYWMNTPLHRAAFHNQPDIVALLLEHNAQIEVGRENGDTPLINSVEKDDIENTDITRMLLDAGANVNTFNKDGINPLLLAVARDSSSTMVSLLLEFNADPNVSNFDGLSAVHMAAVYRDPGILNLLIKAGADLNKKDLVGRTPLLYAALRNCPSSVNRLIEAGADRDVIDKMGRSLIHCAVPTFTLSDLSHLVSKVLNIRGSRPRHLNEPDSDGWSPIHWASKSGEPGVIRLLCKAKANPLKKDRKGWTPRLVAIFHNQRELLQDLKTEEGDKKERRVPAPPKDEDIPNSKVPGGPVQRTRTGLENDASTESHMGTGQEHTVACDSCYTSIWGIRFKCTDCSYFNFCFKCYWHAKKIHNPQHEFKRIGSGPYQGPFSWKDADPDSGAEEESEEEAAITEEDAEVARGAVEAEERESNAVTDNEGNVVD